MFRYTGFLAIIILLASCEKEIKVKLPEYTPLLVVANDATTDGNISVKVGKSINILQYNGTQNFDLFDAVVKLYVNGSYTETLTYQFDTLDFLESRFMATTSAEPGKTYKITVNVPGFPEAEAESGVPEFVSADIKRTSALRTNRWGQVQSEISIQFMDPATKGDYYFIEILTARERDTSAPDSINYQYYEELGCISTTDQSVAAIGDFFFDDASCLSERDLFLSDELFNGTNKEFKFYVDSMSIAPFTNIYGVTTYPLLKFYHVSEDYYRFLKSYRYASDNYQNPFAEPTNVYTNVKNGYGIFSLGGVTTKDLK